MAKLFDIMMADPGVSKWVKDAAKAAIKQPDLLSACNDSQLLRNAIFEYVREKLGKQDGHGK